LPFSFEADRSRQIPKEHQMMKHGMKTRLVVVALAALVVAGGAYAFTAANTVPNSTVGAGSGTVSGYTVTNLHYGLNATNPVNVDTLTFSVSPAIPSTSSGKVIAQATLSSGGPNVYTCTTDSAGTAVSCPTTSPQLTADKLVGVTVVAASGADSTGSTSTSSTSVAADLPVTDTTTASKTDSLVSNWTKTRGGNLITTYSDGRVDMNTTAGERRVLGGSSSATDYTVTSNATLISGAGYGVYVRATVDAGTKLTGYCIQLDHAYGTGQIVVRELQDDFELSTPIAHIAVPADFVWFGTPHAVAVTMAGNSMTISIDGAQQLKVADLVVASAASVKTSWNVVTTITPPAAGGYGLRAWSDGLVTLQKMTVSS
jgi:hypothetical protein